MKVKSLLCTSLGALLAFPVIAVDVNGNFSGDVASSCSVSETTPGTLILSDSLISTDAALEMQIITTEDNAYKVSVANPGDFNTKPTGYNGIGSFTNEAFITGANVSGAIANGAEFNLVNAGIDTMLINLSGTTDINVKSGNYTAIVVVSCVAQ